jgi:N-acetylmuramoyl-L-alanine amidase
MNTIEKFFRNLPRNLKNKYFRRRLGAVIILAIIVLIILISGVKSIIKASQENKQREYEQELFGELQEKNCKVTKFYTYGTSFGLEGTLDLVGKDNFENVKLILVDNDGVEAELPIEGSVTDGVLHIRSEQINNTVCLDKLEAGRTYYLKLRVKTNNSLDPKYYMFENASHYPDIEYYTITRNGKNNKVNISFEQYETVDKKIYSCLYFKVEESQLPEDVYDIVIDAGHGGKDEGYTAAGYNEAEVCLEEAELLKAELEDVGYKVAMTRTQENTDSYTMTNMYDENGRITTACKSKAKIMLSIHITDGSPRMRGIEIFAPPRSDLNYARLLANKIVENTELDFSNDNENQVFDGVYVNNYSESQINNATKAAEDLNYSPYYITQDTPYIYSIREVGGIATNAYMDGRNSAYAKNVYYDSNQGIESYQINLGYIDNDLQRILNGKEYIAVAIVRATLEQFK